MAWDFSTEPEFQKKLDWVEQFCKDEIEPLEYVFPYPVRSPDPNVRALVRRLQQEIKDQGLWAIFLDEELGGPGFGQLKLALLNEVMDFHDRKLVFLIGPANTVIELAQWHE